MLPASVSCMHGAGGVIHAQPSHERARPSSPQVPRPSPQPLASAACTACAPPPRPLSPPPSPPPHTPHPRLRRCQRRAGRRCCCWPPQGWQAQIRIRTRLSLTAGARPEPTAPPAATRAQPRHNSKPLLYLVYVSACPGSRWCVCGGAGCWASPMHAKKSTACCRCRCVAVRRCPCADSQHHAKRQAPLCTKRCASCRVGLARRSALCMPHSRGGGEAMHRYCACANPRLSGCPAVRMRQHAVQRGLHVC